MGEMNGSAVPSPESIAAAKRMVWRWFRLVGVPLIAVTVIAGAILWLRAPSGTPNAVAIDTAGQAGDAAPAPEPGSPAPDFTLQATDGTQYRLSDLRGHPVLINFWATWCGPCREEMPAFEAEYHARTDAGLIVLAVNVREGPNLVGGFIKRLGVTFPVLLDPSGSVSDRYRVHALPTTVLVTPDGVIDGIRTGAYTKKLLHDRLDQFLGQ